MENEIKDTRNYDVHESGHIELSGMTAEEYLIWERIKEMEKNGNEQG